MNRFDNQVGFVVGTGRCGTRFIHQVVELEPNAASSHERNVLNESFHRYCNWYGLPVDHEGFLQAKETEILDDLQEYDFSFEASAQLSSSIEQLHARFNARFVLMVRSPHRVVNSFLRKGKYDKPFVRADADLALGYQESKAFHHFLGRLAPSGEKFHQWNAMSRVGRLAWFWAAVNGAVLDQFQRLPETEWQVVKLEDLSYDRYSELAEFLGFKTHLLKGAYENLAHSRPNAQDNVPTVADWTPTETAEFENEVAALAEKLGYPFEAKDLARMR